MWLFFFFSSRRRHTSLQGDWSSDVCSSDLDQVERDVRTGIGEQSYALADDDGIGEQVELVDQAVGQQPSDEGTAAGHQQRAVLMGLQITDGGGDVAV